MGTPTDLEVMEILHVGSAARAILCRDPRKWAWAHLLESSKTF